MTKLDAVLERIRQLPQDRQELIAVELEFLLDRESNQTSALTDEQWAEVEAELAHEDAEEIPHFRVVEEMRARYGE